MITAKDLLRKDYLRIDVNDTISHFIGQCQQLKTTCALVFDGNDYLGIIDKHVVVNRRINPSNTKVSNIINKRSQSRTTFFVPTIEEDTPLSEICKHFV